MPATQLSEELRALCHEHHVEMSPNQGFSNGEGSATQALAYACTVPDCLIHYNISRGYFMLSQNGGGSTPDEMPKVKCFLDGAPMYLARIDPEKRAFRLWRCPQCSASVTNEESLVGFPPKKIQEATSKSGAQL